MEQNIHTQSKENGSINEREFVQHKNAGIKPNVISTEKSNNETLVNCSFIPKSESKNINLVGLLINILICIYSFLGITIVCQNYFVTSMSRIYEGNFICFLIYFIEVAFKIRFFLKIRHNIKSIKRISNWKD